MIKTKTNKRFGGYAHESFRESKDFHVRDNKTFLFNLETFKIYKSKGSENTLWNYNDESIDFGRGIDLRIFHKFFQGETTQILVKMILIIKGKNLL